VWVVSVEPTSQIQQQATGLGGDPRRVAMVLERGAWSQYRSSGYRFPGGMPAQAT
jgi:hypothetical protein